MDAPADRDRNPSSGSTSPIPAILTFGGLVHRNMRTNSLNWKQFGELPTPSPHSQYMTRQTFSHRLPLLCCLLPNMSKGKQTAQSLSLKERDCVVEFNWALKWYKNTFTQFVLRKNLGFSFRITRRRQNLRQRDDNGFYRTGIPP